MSDEEVICTEWWSRLVWLWLRFWLVNVEEEDAFKFGELAILLARDLEIVDAIGISSMLWLREVVTGLGFEGDNDDLFLSDVADVDFWLTLDLSYDVDSTVFAWFVEELVSLIGDLLRFLEVLDGKVESDFLSRGPVWPRPGPPRRKVVREVDGLAWGSIEDCFWLEDFREESEFWSFRSWKYKEENQA